MFERFTERARRVVVLAQDEARRLGQNYIGTEHLLLGLLRLGEGVTAHVLASLGVTLSETRERVESKVGRGEGATGDQSPLTPRSKKVVVLALGEALEHILLGMAWEPEGAAALALSRLGGRPGTFQARVEELMVQARCGVTDEERAEPQPLRVDLSYLYEAAGEGDDLSGTVDYGMVIEEAAGLLERKEFRLLETGARMVGENILAGFPAVREITVAVTKLRVPINHEVSGVSVETTFGRCPGPS